MIPGIVITLLTFPGVIVHEAAHLLFCRLRRVPVVEVCFFRVGNPAGYVIHEQTDDFTSSFLISVGPFIVNSLLCMLICWPAFLPMKFFDIVDPLSAVLIWLGVSIGMHSFPSTADANNLWRAATVAAKRANPLAIISFPLVILCYVANVGRFFWADAIYGAAIGIGLPMLILERSTRI